MYKWIILIVLFIIGWVSFSYYSRVKEMYIAGIGQKKAIQLSEILIEYHDLEGVIPESLVNELHEKGFFHDLNGRRFQFSELSEHEFKISYVPKLKNRILFQADLDQRLTIKWDKEMEGSLVESNISKP